ncbi:MAG: hypothetical protein R2706_04430 [Acidimicrobiales bacterium]
MELEDNINAFGGQIGKVADAVEFIYENKSVLLGAGRFIADHGDDLLGVIDFLRDHGDDLLDLIQRIPDVLGRAGDALAAAGDAAQAAGAFLVGEDGNDAANITAVAGRAIAECRDHLGTVEGLLGRIGTELEGTPLVGAVGSHVLSGASEIGDVMASLGTVSHGLVGLSSSFGSTGRRLERVGDDITSSGQTLAEMSTLSGGVTKAPGTKPTARRPTTKRPSAKKPAAKKAAAKKPAATTKAPPVAKPRGLGDGVLKRRD